MKESLNPIFQESGHREISEEIRPDVFGSAYSVFDNNRSRIRLVWDGKDGCGYAQIFNPNVHGEWEDIPCYLTEGDLEGEPPNREKIEGFCVAVEKVAV
ncbi:MAG: hypothetical protein LC742_09800 [Acidobacteria bacterium]|nr:hypothetical protein [Acidobacteriota bacterium]